MWQTPCRCTCSASLRTVARAPALRSTFSKLARPDQSLLQLSPQLKQAANLSQASQPTLLRSFTTRSLASAFTSSNLNASSPRLSGSRLLRRAVSSFQNTVHATPPPASKQRHADPGPLPPLPALTHPSVAFYLLGISTLVFSIVVVGGLTRLTESGLSITEWNLVTGTLPPMGEEAWQGELDKYRATPEGKLCVD